MPTSCPFCDIASGDVPENIMCYEDEFCCAFPSKGQRPSNRGHMLVITREHYRNLHELPEALYGPVLSVVRRVSQAVQQAFGASGTTVRQNNGPPGQDVFHLHFHVIPRFDGDMDPGGLPAAPYQEVDLATRVEQAESVRRCMDVGSRDDDDPVETVRAGYDKVSSVYQDDEGSLDPGIRLEAVRELAARLAPGGRVLDLGCGNGMPAARELSRLGCDVVGVDVSPVQVERATVLVPAARFICTDMTSAAFAPSSFDAVVAFWSMIHVPVERQPALLDRVVSWLSPGGWFMATVGQEAWTGVEHDWLGIRGATMYWSHSDWTTFRGWLTARGFTVEQNYFVPEGDGGHQFVLARLA